MYRRCVVARRVAYCRVSRCLLLRVTLLISARRVVYVCAPCRICPRVASCIFARRIVYVCAPRRICSRVAPYIVVRRVVYFRASHRICLRVVPYMFARCVTYCSRRCGPSLFRGLSGKCLRFMFSKHMKYKCCFWYVMPTNIFKSSKSTAKLRSTTHLPKYRGGMKRPASHAGLRNNCCRE